MSEIRESSESKRGKDPKKAVGHQRTNIGRSKENIARVVFSWVRREHTTLFERESVREETSERQDERGELRSRALQICQMAKHIHRRRHTSKVQKNKTP
jgi:hypothetical protein